MGETLVLPEEALASMTVYDLDTDTDGHYVEQIVVPDYDYFIKPLRETADTQCNQLSSMTRVSDQWPNANRDFCYQVPEAAALAARPADGCAGFYSVNPGTGASGGTINICTPGGNNGNCGNGGSIGTCPGGTVVSSGNDGICVYANEDPNSPSYRTFTGACVGPTPDGSDAPHNPKDLSFAEAQKGVQFFFRPEHGWINATFKVTYSGPPGECTGRNLNFAGDSSLCLRRRRHQFNRRSTPPAPAAFTTAAVATAAVATAADPTAADTAVTTASAATLSAAA